jgi:transcriptional regulator with XRE-family HTH domain
MDTKKIGKRVQALRKAAGLNVMEVARKGGLSVVTIYLVEQGRWADMNCSTLLGLCRALGCKTRNILGERP